MSEVVTDKIRALADEYGRISAVPIERLREAVSTNESMDEGESEGDRQ